MTTCQTPRVPAERVHPQHRIPEQLPGVHRRPHRGGVLLLQGNAGNGKTYVALNIIKQYSKRVKVLAPTSKAALNIGGNTKHSSLK